MPDSLQRRLTTLARHCGRALVGALPEPVGGFLRGEARRLLVHYTGDEIVCKTGIWRGYAEYRVPWADVDCVTKLIARLPGGPARARDSVVELSLDRGFWCNASLRLPLTAEAELDGILSIEVERLLPAPASQISFGYTVARSGDDKEILVNLAAIPRRVIDPVVERLHASGLRVGRVTQSDGVSPRHEIGYEVGPAIVLLDTAVASARLARRRLATSFAFAVLILSMAISPLWRLHVAERTLRAEVETARQSAKRTMALIEIIERAEGERIARDRAYAISPSPVRVLNELSKLLPDDTWLIHMAVDGRAVQLEGKTRSSARLVKLIETSPMFEAVDYRSAITRDPNGALERFAFSLDLSGPPE